MKIWAYVISACSKKIIGFRVVTMKTVFSWDTCSSCMKTNQVNVLYHILPEGMTFFRQQTPSLRICAHTSNQLSQTPRIAISDEACLSSSSRRITFNLLFCSQATKSGWLFFCIPPWLHLRHILEKAGRLNMRCKRKGLLGYWSEQSGQMVLPSSSQENSHNSMKD